MDLPTLPRKSSRDTGPLDVALGANIRAVRRNLGWNQHDVASRVGIASQQLHRYEVGTNRLPVTRLVDIAAVLGVTLHDLMPDPALPPISDPGPAHVGLMRAVSELPPDKVNLLHRVARAMLGEAAATGDAG